MLSGTVFVSNRPRLPQVHLPTETLPLVPARSAGPCLGGDLSMVLLVVMMAEATLRRPLVAS